ncbi:restriction endonuclease subunit S [Bacteroides ovatus]|nr:restriction endonuclease subunit S [Bacteroides ovatus]MDC2425640.1 restriction endonuclease subunit S [Bacteroides ovatus]MDC2430479.1 restriction endonuclease subunit S [Bacteroides ovatus]MDC2475487.1 restriction endonuclease subunit S [Bacteroides ovatus]MDC2548398.1 restriction endonuclease subunit S [Bacteroides ovatus]MDC2553153.1 restriction endonuclease subunit S [Bacteroides ovatus]
MADNKENKVLNVPALRFPEFTDEWHKQSLGEIGETIIGLTYKPSDVVESNGTIVLRSSNIKNGVIDYSDLVRVNKPIKERIITKENDILICARNGSQRLIGKNAIIKKEDANNTFGAFMMVYRSKDNPFILPLLSTKRYFSQVGENLGARINQITTSDFNGFDFYFPNSHAERAKIAELFRLIDERIATQNKIIEDLKKLKSAIVEMILCKQGGVLLKLGDVGSFIRGLTYSSEDIAEDINATTVIRANNLNYGNNVSKKDVVYVNKKPTEIQILRKGDIVICMANGSSSLVGKNSYYSFDDRQSTIGAFCGIYRSSQPLVKWLMQSQRYRRLVYQSLQGGNGAIANLNGDDILNMTFYVVEDKKSVSILSALVLIENSIAVNEKLQELYSMQKEYLLQHLFI